MAKTILVIDDAIMVRKLAQKTAEGIGYNVITAEDGLEALVKLKENDIDFVFSDINMPNMGGLEMVAEIRKDAKAIGVAKAKKHPMRYRRIFYESILP